jgi:hypothetical protein
VEVTVISDIVERLRRERETDHLAIEAADEIELLRAALQGLLGEVMCFSVDPPSAALNHAIEEARRALGQKPNGSLDYLNETPP